MGKLTRGRGAKKNRIEARPIETAGSEKTSEVLPIRRRQPFYRPRPADVVRVR